MNKKKLADAFRIQEIRAIRETSDDDIIWHSMVCPDCGSDQHDLEPEEVDNLVAEASSLDDFESKYTTAIAERRERGLFAAPLSGMLH